MSLHQRIFLARRLFSFLLLPGLFYLFVALSASSFPVGADDGSPEDIQYADVVIPTGNVGSPVTGGNAIDQAVLHPAIPLLDEKGRHVLDSGQPYSPKSSCGVGSGCHDYEAISHGQHFEMGRDEARDNYGTGRGGWSMISSPGYFGGFSCMGSQILAKKGGGHEFSGDFGAAGQIKACGQCHSGGGWAEKDRNGIRYDEKWPGTIKPLDGDYFNRGTDTHNQPVAPAGKAAASGGVAHGGWRQTGLPLTDSPVVSRWNFRSSGVLENDCMMCHGDYTSLTLFPASGLDSTLLPADYSQWFDIRETPAIPYKAWWNLRNEQLIGQGFFRESASALLEFINIRPGTPAGMNLLNFQRSPGQLAPQRDKTGKPLLKWNPAAFDSNRKTTLPMLRFPGNDNCWQCHGNAIEQDRRGFWGFGEVARGRQSAYAYKADVHKGRLFTENNHESRQINTCAACHTQGIYYNPAFANVALDADHNFPKGHSDIDVRRDKDNRPEAKSCEYCHDQAVNKVIPSGHPTLSQAHRERWKSSGFLDGYPKDSLTQITNTHLDVVACQTCHIKDLRDFAGQPITLFYRYRRAGNGRLKIVPTVDQYQFRYYWRDKNSGRVLRQGELFSVYTPRLNRSGEVVAGVLEDPITQARYELPGAFWMPYIDDHAQFKTGSDYQTTLALKRNYDALLKKEGLANPDTQLVWIQANAYVVSHNTRASVDAVPCGDCHARKQSGAFSALVSYTGLLGEGNIKVLSEHADQRLLDEGIVVLGESYLSLDEQGRIVTNMSDLLYASKQDPSLSALKAESATRAGGEWVVQSLADAWQSLRIADTTLRANLGRALASREVFSFSLASAARELRDLAVVSPADSISPWGLSRYRLEAEYTPLSPEHHQAIVQAGLGQPVSGLFSLKMLAPDKTVARSFFGQSVWAKLPYPGQRGDISRIRLVTQESGIWKDSGLVPRWIQLAEADHGASPGLGNGLYPTESGYILVRLDKPFTRLTLTELP